MRRREAGILALEVVGCLLLTAGVAAWSWPAALIVAGLLCVAFGLAAERGGEGRDAR